MDLAPRRIGILVPPANWTIEAEIPRYLPPGVAVNIHRLSRRSPESFGEERKKVTRESLGALALSLGPAAIDLAEASPEVIVYCCTSGSFVNGHGRQTELSDKITALTGVPATTTSAALLQGLTAVGARRVFLVTPYPDNINALEIAFLEYYGFEVVHADSVPCENDDAIRATPSSAVADLILSQPDAIARADAIFISCTNLRAMDQIERLEAETGLPVLCSNQVSLWAALGALGLTAPGPGSLFSRPLPAEPAAA
ncbi:maleate cis-trans isomerase family protein [Acuticoccus kandeliae]|uniref:maleate cis-trans isomerase family protein n=1 Tax=Acuticoccus kandeliae TaxID=2073160 RepID=UPI0013006288|nr:aspartate/glutamate racemase family protein [Acuticoccus kandeliae]